MQPTPSLRYRLIVTLLAFSFLVVPFLPWWEFTFDNLTPDRPTLLDQISKGTQQEPASGVDIVSAVIYLGPMSIYILSVIMLWLKRPRHATVRWIGVIVCLVTMGVGTITTLRDGFFSYRLGAQLYWATILVAFAVERRERRGQQH